MYAVRRRHRHLGQRFGVRLQESEGTHDRARPPADLALHSQFGKSLRDAAFVSPFEARGAGAVGCEALPAEDKLEPPAAPAELAVGDRLQADALLRRDAFADAAVLDGAQFRAVMRPQVALRGLRSEEALARLLKRLWPQQAADLVGAERRAGARAHGAPDA